MTAKQFLAQLEIWKESLKDIPPDLNIAVGELRYDATQFTAFIATGNGLACAIDFDNYNQLRVRDGRKPLSLEENPYPHKSKEAIKA